MVRGADGTVVIVRPMAGIVRDPWSMAIVPDTAATGTIGHPTIGRRDRSTVRFTIAPDRGIDPCMAVLCPNREAVPAIGRAVPRQAIGPATETVLSPRSPSGRARRTIGRM